MSNFSHPKERMRYFIIIILSVFMFAGLPHALAKKHKYAGAPKTEVDLMNNILGCLQHKDSLGYFYLFPPFDTLWHMVLHNPDHSPEAVQALNQLKEHPQALIAFDPFFNHDITTRFCRVLTKGEDSGIHWNSVVVQRYEFQKENLTRNLAGFDRIAPERFTGYLFVRDLLGRLTFCINITEIQKIDGYFVGGQVLNILEASTIEQFMLKEEAEQKYFEWLAKHPKIDSMIKDSLKRMAISEVAKDALADTGNEDNDTGAVGKKPNLNVNNPADEEEKAKIRKEIIDRKYYEGKFDDDLPAKLYVRYMKDSKSGKILSYDGLYKFGDQDNWVKLNITINPLGKWIMEDDPPVGTMDLELKNKIYTGGWSNNGDGTGYDVVMKQADIPTPKLEELDNILEKGLSGSASDETITDKNGKKKKPHVDYDKGIDDN
jgi:hypothetical protein